MYRQIKSARLPIDGTLSAGADPRTAALVLA